MRLSALLFVGMLGILAIRPANAVGGNESAQAARVRLAALPRISKETWKSLTQQHGWLYGSTKATIKVIGILTPSAPLSARNILFGSPDRDSDFVCKTLLLPTEGSPNWNMAAKLRVAYALLEPKKYKTPALVLNQQKQIAEPKPGTFEKEWQAIPADVQKQAEAEVGIYQELAKRLKVNTYYALLPNDEVVEIGHPFNVERVWNDYLMAKGN